ncbi:MAG: bifunctional phosphopantothenoylcysteine decarboxylase/phosphopantothenate--cysteine ligase CoaBC [Prevotella shahii]|uniref:bifunctional phosphopantothenoylcysteine decarboxylase/phosphopantothenate--cysteine ligase CoaBC n=2 Tax=Hoylesella shahii TaxID=228603 RepID=UPI001CACC9F8|nr:bifunctional phosphopantothenoylcysteine decarboxylase/phosphopantothenate--cysteine ligase CoaBC [Hoylesella shahii]MBF1590686.1 bifunctional phosphopantothenoylcysteine decarboxylase/phosphopantothenate--cysteine ligase CoaBC [Hoylesella shahii]
MLKGKKIVLGITGSIAAYKACLIVRLLMKQGVEVQVVITDAGKQFITPVTLSALTGKPVVSEFFTANDGTWHSHVDLGLWADAMLIAPCTASSLGKMVHGIADNMLITTYLSMKAPVFVAPAMDLDMYAHPSTQGNIERLKQVGNIIIEPQAGFLASGLEGKGRMEEPENIVATLEKYFEDEDNGRTCTAQGQLAGKKVLITAGPTYEKIDPVRFIGNYSSGKMGFALAEECSRRGADVVLVAGPVSLQCSAAIRRINVESADEMHAACIKAFAQSDAAILCAAVADFKPSDVVAQKIKREGNKLTLELTSTPDIAAALGREKQSNQVLVGFALETDNEETNALKKLKSKNLDFIVLNSLRNEGTCFGTDNNKVNIISDSENRQFDFKSKPEVAKDIVDYLCERMKCGE